MRLRLALPAVLFCCVACRGQQAPEVKITHEELGNAWPFTVSEGVLSCRPGQEVVFTAGGTSYAINGAATDSKKYAEIQAVWADNPLAPGTRKDIGPILDRGMKLCL